MNSFSDESLMIKVRDDDVDRLGLLFERHHRALYNFFLRMMQDTGKSEDLVQEVFFRILKYRHTYKEGVPFIRWMFHIARNVANDHFRGKRDEVELEDEAGSDDSTDILGKLSHDVDVNTLKQALALLSEEKREVLILSRFHDMKYNDIAKLTGSSVSAVKVRVHRALKDLRDGFFRVAQKEAS